MGADLRALVRIEKAFEQRAEDGRIDLAPVEACRRLQQADAVGIERQRAAAVEQAAVEIRDFFQSKIAAMFHRGEELVEISLGGFRLLGGAFEQPRVKVCGQQLHAVGKKAEHELIDEMGDLLAGAAALQAQRDGREFVGGFLGDRGARLGGPQLFGIKKDRVENIEIFGSPSSSSENS